jgi:hypothetical protein
MEMLRFLWVAYYMVSVSAERAGWVWGEYLSSIYTEYEKIGCRWLTAVRNTFLSFGTSYKSVP